MDLQLPCSVNDCHDNISTARTRFLTDVFGIAPTSIDGNERVLGMYLPVRHPAVFWMVDIICARTVVISVRSNYHVTLVDIHEWRTNKTYTFAIHPVPIDELCECRMANIPQWSISVDGYDVALVGDQNIQTWYGSKITVILDGWIPDHSFIGRY